MPIRHISANNSFGKSSDDIKAAKQEQDRQRRRFTASYYGMNNGGYSAPNIIGLAPEYFVPQLENSSLELPRYRQEIASWCDFYYQTNELIGAAVDTHATLAVADFAISCKDRVIQQEYEDMLDDLDFMELLLQIAYEFFRVGNAFPMGEYDEYDRCWKEFALVPMLNVELQRSVFSRQHTKIYLIPDQSLKFAQSSQDPAMRQEFESLPSDVKKKIQQNHPILLDPDRVSHISTNSIAGTMWGVPPVFRCFKTLVYNDKIFRSQEAIADRHTTPLRIIGLSTPEGTPVTPQEAEDFRTQLIEADLDPNYFIITAGQVKDNYIGSNGRVMPLNNEMDMVEKRICAGMKINKALLHGEGPTYANAQVYQATMNLFYLLFRQRLKKWLLKKVFKPIAEARGYYTKDKNEDVSNLNVQERTKRLILPDIIWRGVGGLDSGTLGIMKELKEAKELSKDTYMKMALPDVDREEERAKVLRESQEEQVTKDVAPEIANAMSPQEDGIPGMGGGDFGAGVGGDLGGDDTDLTSPDITEPGPVATSYLPPRKPAVRPPNATSKTITKLRRLP